MRRTLTAATLMCLALSACAGNAAGPTAPTTAPSSAIASPSGTSSLTPTAAVSTPATPPVSPSVTPTPPPPLTPCGITAVAVDFATNTPVTGVLTSASGLTACVISVADAVAPQGAGPLAGKVVTEIVLTVENRTPGQLPLQWTTPQLLSLGGAVQDPGPLRGVNTPLPQSLPAGGAITQRFLFGNSPSERSDWRISWGDCVWWENPKR